MSMPPDGTAGIETERPAPSPGRVRYRIALDWVFASSSALRLLTYLPMLWAIHASADSTQHSLLTWLAWLTWNLVMAAWLYEHNGRRVDKAVRVTLGNASMCAAASVLIAWYR